MMNSKKLNRTTIGLMLIALLLVLSTVLTLTNAWFTDSDGASGVNKDFGTVELSVSATDFGKITRVSNTAPPPTLIDYCFQTTEKV